MRVTERKKALKELLAKVEAGEVMDWRMYTASFGLFTDDRHIKAASAYKGSLDAAKALHEAMLPEWVYGINFDAHKEIYAFVGDGVCYETDECYSDNPARAWLIAILKALIAEVDQ